jgi:hypothetical protein
MPVPPTASNAWVTTVLSGAGPTIMKAKLMKSVKMPSAVAGVKSALVTTR